MMPKTLVVTLVLRAATPLTDAGTLSAPTPQLEDLLAKHRTAMGGDNAVNMLRRWKLTSRVRAYGLTGTTVDYADGSQRRSEQTFPELPLQTVDVWDVTVQAPG